jgi:hypothetical protein
MTIKVKKHNFKISLLENFKTSVSFKIEKR